MTAVYIASAFAVIGAVSAWGFVVHYSLAAAWWRSNEGRQIFAAAFSIACFLTLALVSRLIGQYWWYESVAVLMYALISITQTTLWLLFISNRRRSKKTQTLKEK